VSAVCLDRNDLIRRFTANRASLLGYLRVLVRDTHLAEDLFQETCLVVLQKIETFDPTQDFDAWQRGIAANLARSAWRRDRRLRLMPSPELSAALDAAHAPEAGDGTECRENAARLEHLHACLQGMTARQRQLLELRYQIGASLREMALATRRSAGGVQVTLSRLRQALLNCVEQKGRVANHG